MATLPLITASARIQFMEDSLALIHIPLHLYPYFLGGILQLLFHDVRGVDQGHYHDDDDDDDDELGREETETAQMPSFLNFSLTPIECSIMCPWHLAEAYIAPLIEGLKASTQSQSQSQTPDLTELSISWDDYLAMQVIGTGVGAGQRVLDLTSPLAMAGISIFFITTYFSDYIIVPSRSKTQVIEALEKRGFRFEGPGGSDGHAYSHTHTHQNGSHIPSTSSTTPPPSSLEDLQSRTFSSLRKNHISPIVDRGLRLVHCAARYDTDASSLSLLRNALTTSLLVDNPRFLSLTFAAGDDSASLLMEKRLIPRFSSDNEPEPENEGDLLLRSIDEIVPIILDLRRLPLEATGIVCGVASRLAEATRLSPRDVSDDNTDGECSRPASSCSSFGDLVGLSDLYKEGPSFQPVHNPHLHPQTGSFTPSEVDISFLSTARAGTIVVDRGQVRCAVEALDVESWVSGLVG